MRFSRVLACRAVLAVLISPSFSAGTGAAQQPPPSFHFSAGDASLNIPFELVADGLVFVRAQIEDHPGWFIVDNATQGFTVDRAFARRNSLHSSGQAPARGGGPNTIDAGIIRDVRIGLPGLELTHRNLTMIDLQPIEPAIGHEVDGIVGSRLFDDFVVTVDYEHQRLSIEAPQKFRPSGKETALPVRVDQHGFPFIDATLALPGLKPIPGNFLIDGGANTWADLYKPFCDAHGIPAPGMKLLNEPGTSTGGTTQSRDGRADAITVGPWIIHHPAITLAEDTEGLMAAQDYAGLIGTEFLERFTVVFDNPGKRILLTPNRHYADAVDYDASGLRIHADPPDFHTFAVGRILPGSPAAEAGMEPGDIIESFDGRSAQEMTLTELRALLRRPGARCSLGIRRGSIDLQVALRLRFLL
jgi:hypothetical protein